MSENVELDTGTPRRPQKSEAAFRTISEVSEDLDVPQHVLRFWESRFTLIKPLKRGGGRRYYRPEDVQLLRRIRDLLYKDGYTIRGVQKLLREQARDIAPAADSPSEPPLTLALVEAVPQRGHSTTVATDVQPSVKPDAVAPVAAPQGGISAARRALLESVVGELDELRGLLAAARGK